MDLKVFGREIEIKQIKYTSHGDVEVLAKGQSKTQVFHSRITMEQAPDLHACITKRVDRVYASTDLKRLGLTERETPFESRDREYDIQRIFLASDHEKGLYSDRYYGSNLTHGGTKTFWPIMFHTIKSHAIHVDTLPGSPFTSDLEVDSEDARKPSIEIVYSPARRAAFLDALDTWCTEHPGKFFKLFYPGHRGDSSLAHKCIIAGERNFCIAKESDCLRAALANSLYAMDGRNTAMNFLRAGPMRGNSIGNCAHWLETTMRMFRLVKVHIPPGVELHNWVLSQKEGIYILIVEGIDQEHDTLLHAISVDLNRQMVFDCIERNVMKLRPGVFDVCVGDNVEFVGVSDVRKLMHQNVGSRKRSSRRMRTSSRRWRKSEQRKEEGDTPRDTR